MASVFTLGLVAAAFVLIFYVTYRFMRPKPLPGIPYNRISALRLTGDVPDFFAWQAAHGDMFSYIPKLAEQLGSPIFQVFMRPFGKPWVILVDPRESYDIMTRRFKEFDRSEFFGDSFKAALPEFHIHFPTGKRWHEHRRMVAETMSPWFLHNVAGPQMWTTTQKLMELWREKTRLAEGRTFAVARDVHKSALDIIWAAAFGQEIGSNRTQAEYLKGIQIMHHKDTEITAFSEVEDPPEFTSILTLTESMDIPVTSTVPWLHHWFALTFYPKLAAARKQKDKMIQAKLHEAQIRHSSKSLEEIQSMKDLGSALDMVIAKEVKAAKRQRRPPSYDSQDIQDELFGFLIAGHETTSTTICWALKLLTEHQNTQTKLRDALKHQFQSAHHQSRQPSIEEITSASIPYLEALMQELGRYSYTGIAKIRKSICETEILGYHVPKGIDVFMMNNGQGYLSQPLEISESKRSKTSQSSKDKTPAWEDDDIASFRVERWLVEDDQGKITFNANAGPTIPFGAGPRACFGKKWALLEVKILLVLIFWNFEMLPISKELSEFRAIDGVTHRPETVYLRPQVLL